MNRPHLSNFFSTVARTLVICAFAASTLTAQTIIETDCFQNDYGGAASSGNPDNITLENPSATNLVFDVRGCLTPSQADYNDLFTFVVPAGFKLASIALIEFDPLFDHTELGFFLWIGSDCQPINSADVGVENIDKNEVPTGNLINSLGPPLNSGAYSVWMELEELPGVSTSFYTLRITLQCDDEEAPELTSEPGSLDASILAGDQAALDAALALTPTGTDNSGTVIAEVISDETTPNPPCKNAYTRVRIFQLEDLCGNVAEATFTQTITVYDNIPTITFGTMPTVCQGTTLANLPYITTQYNPDQYRINFNIAAEAAGFTDSPDFTALPASPISITVPANAPGGVYTATLTLRNSESECVSEEYVITVTVLEINAGLIGSNQSVCVTKLPDPFTSVQDASAVPNAALEYQWQQSTEGCDSEEFTDIENADAATYTVPEKLQQTTYYRRKVTATLNNVNCEAFSNCIQVKVLPVDCGQFPWSGNE
ncbi:MAG: hypothetical protein ACK4TA_10655 [Saprospiraceae bacterium]